MEINRTEQSGFIRNIRKREISDDSTLYVFDLCRKSQHRGASVPAYERLECELWNSKIGEHLEEGAWAIVDGQQKTYLFKDKEDENKHHKRMVIVVDVIKLWSENHKQEEI